MAIKCKVVVGIDTGVNGAIAVLLHGTPVEVHDMPKMTFSDGKGGVDCRGLRRLLDNAVCLAEAHDAEVLVVIEDVHAMPKQGVTSSFNFGMAKGMTIGVALACGLPVKLSRPQAWKKACGLLRTEKDFARTKACNTWPEFYGELKRKKDIDRADAMWIAWAAWLEGD